MGVKQNGMVVNPVIHNGMIEIAFRFAFRLTVCSALKCE